MPIIGLTNRDPKFPQIGVLRKGDPKPESGKQPGKNLTYFRFDTDDAAVAAKFAELFGDKPQVVRVLMPYPTVEQNFSAWQEAWSGSSIRHRCDGQHVVLYRDPQGNIIHVKAGENIPCPDKNKPRNDATRCKPVGRLNVIIPNLARMALVTVLTHSINDIMELDANLRAAFAINGGSVAGVPFLLVRRKRIITKRKPDGASYQGPEWLLSLEPAPDWVERKLTEMQSQALPQLPAPPQFPQLIMTDSGLVNADTGEVMEPPVGVEEAEEGEWVEAPTEASVAPGPSGEAEPTQAGDDPNLPPVIGGDPDSEGFVDGAAHRNMMALLNFIGAKSDEQRHEFVQRVTGGRTNSSKEMTPNEASQILTWLNKRKKEIQSAKAGA